MRLDVCLLVAALAVGGCATKHPTSASTTTPNTTEVAAGGAQLRGGGIRMDVQIGRPLATQSTRNDRVTAAPHATVTP